MKSSVRYETRITREWIIRKEAKGLVITADEIWQKIHSSWPGLTEEEKERVFQRIEKRKL